MYYILNELIKSYHVFSKFDTAKAADILTKINDYRLQIATLADQREIFYSQVEVPANASGYKNDIFFTRDDIDSLVSKMIAFLELTATVSLTQLGTRENIFTRQSVPWQQLMSDVQDANPRGQQIPFEFTEEIYLGANESLDIGVTNQTVAGMIGVHGCNLKDDYTPNADLIKAEILSFDENGEQKLPRLQIVPIQFKFTVAAADNKAVAIDGSKDIFSVKSNESVILTEVSTTSVNSRISLLDAGRNQEICTEMESLLIAGYYQNQYTTYYPLPYPHMLRRLDRLQLRGLNGSNITGTEDTANEIQTIAFRGFTI